MKLKKPTMVDVRKMRLVNHQGPLLLVSAVIGLIGGFVAILFHSFLESLHQLIIIDLAGIGSLKDAVIPHYLFWLVPMIGGLVSGILVYKFAPETAGHGTDAMINTFHNKGGKVRRRVPLVKSITSIFTIASGGSAGYEGPVAQVGSGLGSMLTRLFRLHPKNRRILTLAGTAAGLGAIFKAPLGGALTSVEVLYKEDFETDAFLTSIIASVVGYTTYCTIIGYAPVLNTVPQFGFDDFRHIFFYILFGVILAPFSWVYVKTFYGIRSAFRKFSIPKMFQPAVGGLFVGLLFYIEPRVIGGGWEYLIEIFFEKSPTFWYALSLLGLCLFKMVATSFTVGSGGSGGVFGPSLFIGGVLGGAYGIICQEIFPGSAPEVGAMVLVGMSAFFAGVANAPIASIIMVCELTGNYHLLVPLMLASTIHIFLGKNWSIYENQVENKFHSNAHRLDRRQDILKEVKVREIIHEHPIKCINPLTPVSKLLNLVRDTTQDIFPVTDEEGKLIGIVNVHNLRSVLFNKEVHDFMITEDLMERPFFLRTDMDLHHSSQIFLRYGSLQMTVVDENKKPLALLRPKEIFKAYDLMLKNC
jgi:CIC family chloride channel protein